MFALSRGPRGTPRDFPLMGALAAKQRRGRHRRYHAGRADGYTTTSQMWHSPSLMASLLLPTGSASSEFIAEVSLS